MKLKQKKKVVKEKTLLRSIWEIINIISFVFALGAVFRFGWIAFGAIIGKCFGI